MDEKKQTESKSQMKIRIVSMLSDNYAYLIIDQKTKKAACVDPVEPKKIIAAAKEEGVKLTVSLTTHSHWDHAGGNSELAGLVKGIKIVGGYGDNAAAVTQEVKHDDEIKVGNLTVRTLYTPCHTPGHVCFFIDPKDGTPPVVFTGDTMFIGGCGNFNSGTPKMMYKAMVTILGSLPKETRVYVGHEYTVKNFKFGLYAEPDNKALKTKLEWAKARRSQGLPTVPSTIADELETNPFMRVHQTTIQKFTGKTDPVEAIFAVRKMKDIWGQKQW